ncbi:glycerophosphodiester phosphodiesterase [Microbulbifer litoralis]|uniref:glycerophosphodiester phosphodiesterase n=1 Tax=Microbulbifer litoralis TaxID=2933965 RepID=UPI0020295341|nr:glycerophosphodiester phosphodiesterase [Microbulbifer sp. GX H0434]
MLWLALFAIVVFLLWCYATARPVPLTSLSLAHRHHPLVISHGDDAGNGLYPGNTLFYLQKMVELGVDALELDLNLTADGHLVLMHDGTVDRTSDGSGAIIEMTLDELRELNVAHRWSSDGGRYPYRDSPLRIATIDEVFAALPETPIVIELKNDDPLAARVLSDAIEKAGCEARVIVSSFHRGVIREFRRLSPRVATGATMPEALLFFIAQWLFAERLLSPAYQTMQLPMHYYGIPVFSARFVNAARNCGLHLSVWTVDEPEDMRDYIELGLDGIVTNRPDRLMALLEETPDPDFNP